MKRIGTGVSMHFTFASWNVRDISDLEKTKKMLNLIARENPQLLALQEVNPKFHSSLCQSGYFDSASFSLDLWPPRRGDSKDRRRGCSVFGKRPFTLTSSAVLDKLPFPEQTLAVKVCHPEGSLTACSFHIPPGVSHLKEKVLHLYGIAHWLATKEKIPAGSERKSTIIFGIDANEPKEDYSDITKNKWFRDGAAELLGAASKRLHGLEDAFRSCPVENRDSRPSTPSGSPLAVSFKRGHGSSAIPCRYDFIYATKEVRVTRAKYLYTDSRLAGSDHAIVVADLRIPNSVGAALRSTK